MFEETTKVFRRIYQEWKLKLLDNNVDLLISPNIPDDVINKVRSNFQLHIDEIILYVRDTSFWNERNQGTVVTDWGITCVPDNNSPNELVQIAWENVLYVEYSGKCLYFFYSNNRNDNSPIHISHLLKETDDEDVCKHNGNILAEVFTELANTQLAESLDDIYERTAKEYNRLIDEGKEDEALQVAINFREEQNSVAFTPQIAWAYHEDGQDKKALQILNEDINDLGDNIRWKANLAYYKYSIYEDNKDFSEARKICLYVVKNAPSDLTRSDGVKIQEDATRDFNRFENYCVQHFLEQPYNERKLIVPVKSYSDLSQKTLSVIDINNLPNIHFPMGHPVANQLYVGHPYIPSNYIPFENYELTFIEDKVREFCQIMQYLGATEINIECINTTSSNKDTNLQQKGSGNVDYKVASVSGEGERNRTNKFLEEISQSINLHQTFCPKSKPMLPSDLVWYAHEPSWQRLYNQRMQGALIEHEERIETRKSQVVENSDLKRISAEVKWLFVEANGNWEQSMEEKFEAHDNAILAIRVKFAPLESLQDTASVSQQPALNSGLTMTENEKEYLEEIKACLEEDGEISSKERRLLDRLRNSLGISVERAEELEKSLQEIQLTEEEKEYMEEYKACWEEGEISSKERRLLDKLRNRLGISEERAKEIEEILKM